MLEGYVSYITDMLGEIVEMNMGALTDVVTETARYVEQARLIYVYGPGGHANIATQEAFFRAGGLMNIAAILEEGTMLSSGALRSLAMERTPGYGRVVIDNSGLGEGDLLDRKSTRLNSSHVSISYAVFCLKKNSQRIISKHWKYT